jgi:hypothetical protein
MFVITTDPFARLHEALDECAAAPVGVWSDAGVAEAVRAWSSAMSRLAGVGARLLYRWDRTGGWASDGAANGTQWLNARGVDLGSRHLRVANNLHRWAPLTTAALEADELSYAKAAVIGLAITDDNAESFAVVEEVIVGTAKRISLHGTRQLLARWKRVAEQEADPEVDPDEARRDRRYLHLHETFDGMWAVEGLLDPEVGAALKEAIDDLERRFHRQDVADARVQREADERAARAEADALAGLDTDDTTGADTHTEAPVGSDIEDTITDGTDTAGEDSLDGDTAGLDDTAPARRERAPIPDSELARTGRQRRADALAELLANHQAGAHRHGGPRSHLHLNATWDQLRSAASPERSGELRLPDPATFEPGYEPPHTDHQHAFPDYALAREACDCFITRMIVDDHGVPLDLGRTQRLVSPAQRRALIERDRHCAYPDCDRGPEWCDAHHIVPWEDLGPTDLDNLALLCRYHHTRMHLTDGDRCHLDPATRRPEFTRADGTPIPPTVPHQRWRPPDPPPALPPDRAPAWVTAAA